MEPALVVNHTLGVGDVYNGVGHVTRSLHHAQEQLPQPGELDVVLNGRPSCTVQNTDYEGAPQMVRPDRRTAHLASIDSEKFNHIREETWVRR